MKVAARLFFNKSPTGRSILRATTAQECNWVSLPGPLDFYSLKQFATASLFGEFVHWNRSHMRFCYFHGLMAGIVPEPSGHSCTVHTEVGDVPRLKLLNRYRFQQQ